eukprot:g592.t1
MEDEEKENEKIILPKSAWLEQQSEIQAHKDYCILPISAQASALHFDPFLRTPDLRLRMIKYTQEIKERKPNDVFVCQDLLTDISVSSLKEEISDEIGVLKRWHGDSHFIADSKFKPDETHPIFNRIVKTLCDVFQVKPDATRINMFVSGADYKPFHHDAAAFKLELAKRQNIAVVASFGATREISFSHAKTKTTVNIELPHGSVYSFGNAVNCAWRHGIPAQYRKGEKMPSNFGVDSTRISVVVWGKGKVEN